MALAVWEDKLTRGNNNFYSTDGVFECNSKCPPLPSWQEAEKDPRLFHIKGQKVYMLPPSNKEKPLSSQDVDCLPISKRDYQPLTVANGDGVLSISKM